MKKLYFECATGISGDMVVAGLLDMGADAEKLQDVLNGLKSKIGGFDIKISDVTKSAIRAKDFDVILEEDNHDHDMDYLYGHLHDHDEHQHEHHHDHHHDDHHHEHSHEHHHEHDHDHEHHHHEHHHDHHHVHRSLNDVIEIINQAELTEGARALAIKVFTIVAEAEAAVHGRTVDEVHFHEVGAIDSIVDIIAAAVCFDDIATREGITEVVIPKVVDGSGTIRCQHGILPVPVPAVLKIAEQTGLPIGVSNRQGEFVTPTGAAFAAAVMTEAKLPESFRVVKTGLGAGKRDYEIPGILRVIEIETT